MSKTDIEPIYEVDEGVGLVKANSIEPFDDPSEQFDMSDIKGLFDNPVDVDRAKRAVGRVLLIEDLLKMQEVFGERACWFCLLEASVFVRIATSPSGCEAKLSDGQRAIVQWLRTKTPDEIDEILHSCSQGVRIRLVKRRENAEKKSRYNSCDDCDGVVMKIVGEAEKTGRTTLTVERFYESAERPLSLNKDQVSAYVKLTKDALLSKGFLGVGDGEGTYVSPTKCSRSEVAGIVSTRLKSIVADLESIKKICTETHYLVPRQGVEILARLVYSLGDDGKHHEITGDGYAK